jgi:hypothetical protein
MTRFIMPIILIGISISIFFLFANPIYNDISALKIQAASYNDALANSKALENERDKLTAKYNSINPDNLIKIQKLLPDNVDNIRLILEIEQIASPYGIVLKNIKYNVLDNTTSTGATTAVAAVQVGALATQTPQNYGTFDLEFSTSSTYDNFINFSKDLESNLRIVDISSISFTSNVSNPVVGVKTNQEEIYQYDFHIKTYWLKN